MSMENFVIKVDPSSLESSHRIATGTIFCLFNGIPFPEMNWNDNPIIILGWWFAQIFELVKNEANPVDLLFMEGVYQIRVFKQDNDFAQLEAIFNDDVPVHNNVRVGIKYLLNELVKASEIYLHQCDINHWFSPDVESLRHAINLLPTILIYLNSDKYGAI